MAPISAFELPAVSNKRAAAWNIVILLLCMVWTGILACLQRGAHLGVATVGEGYLGLGKQD
jgi:hypothetical protein